MLLPRRCRLPAPPKRACCRRSIANVSASRPMTACRPGRPCPRCRRPDATGRSPARNAEIGSAPAPRPVPNQAPRSAPRLGSVKSPDWPGPDTKMVRASIQVISNTETASARGKHPKGGRYQQKRRPEALLSICPTGNLLNGALWRAGEDRYPPLISMAWADRRQISPIGFQ